MIMKIVFFSTPAYGHIISVFPVIKKMVGKGVNVEWYCSEKYRDTVLSSGAKFIEYTGDFEKYCNIEDAVKDLYSLFCKSLELNIYYYRQYLNVEKPDIILYDSMCAFAKNIALKRNIPHICLCTTMAYNPLVFFATNIFLKSLPVFFKHRQALFEKLRLYKAFMKEQGIKKGCITDIFMNKGNKSLVFIPAKLQPFVFSFPKDIIFIGPTVAERRKNVPVYAHFDIYIAAGSVQKFGGDLYKKILTSKFFRDKKVLISTGDKSLVSPKKNIVFIDRVPQTSVLKNCRIFINHGGLNSVLEAVSENVPQICIPFQEEQRLNAIMVQKKGLGVYIKDFDVEKIAKFYNERGKYRKNIKKYSAVVNGCNSAEHGANIVMTEMCK